MDEFKHIWYFVPEGCAAHPADPRIYRDDVLYLNELLDTLSVSSTSIVRYFAPDADDIRITAAEVQSRLESSLGQKITSPVFLEADFSSLGCRLTIVDPQTNNILGNSDVSRVYSCMDINEDSLPGTMFNALPESVFCERKLSKPVEEDEEEIIEDIIRTLRYVNEQQLRNLGISGKALRFLLGKEKSCSRMRIDRHSKIYLDDYKQEIRLDDKTKALYFLFLRHPEGLKIKDLPDHTDELMDLYQSISGRDDLKAMRKTVEELANPFLNNANISLSRIKKAFVESFDEDLAKAYYIDGKRGEVRSIALDRNLVTWETIR